jgi:dCMP deaminase
MYTGMLLMEEEKKAKRPDWDEYFMGIAEAVAKRATCDRGRLGCVLVRDKRILSTGYVGSPMGIEHCDEIGHQMKTTTHEDGKVSRHCVRTSHAEINAIALAARNGVSIDGATLYGLMSPCYTCAKMLVNAGIKRVVSKMRYHQDKDTEELFKQAGVQFDIWKDEVVKYNDM